MPVGGEVARLDELMRRLRVEDPWKAEQTHDTLKRYLLEESYEVLEAIDAYDPDTGAGAEELCAELGDLLYQVVFHSSIGAEAGWFTLADVAAAIHDKLVRRHPHIFDGAPAAASVDELVAAWEADKRTELGRDSVMDGIPSAMPALARALKVVKKSESLGYPVAAVGQREPPATPTRWARCCSSSSRPPTPPGSTPRTPCGSRPTGASTRCVVTRRNGPRAGGAARST